MQLLMQIIYDKGSNSYVYFCVGHVVCLCL